MNSRFAFLIALACGSASAFGQGEPLSPEQAVRAAWQTRPILRAAEARVREAQAQRSAASAYPATRLEIGRGTDAVPGSTDDDLALVQPIDLFGKAGAAGRAGDRAVRVAEMTLRAARLDVQEEVLRAFNEVVAADRQRDVAAATLDLATKLLDATQRRIQAGQVPEVLAVRAGLEHARARQAFEVQRSRAEASRRRLSGVMGPIAGVPVDFVSSTIRPTPALASTRPDLALLVEERALVEARIRQQRLANRPEVSLQARRSPWMDRAEIGLRLQVSMPILDSGRNRDAERALGYQAEAIAARLADERVRAEAEVEALTIEIAGAEAQVTRLNEMLGSSRELVEITQKGFEAGALTLVETLEANRATREVEETLIEARLRLAQLQVAYFSATGLLLEDSK